MLTGEIDILPSLFGSVAIPNAVQAEMLHSEAPRVVRSWAEAPPPWLTIAPARIEGDAENPRRGAGERAVIALALATGAELILMDDRAGIAAALAKRLPVIGTLGVLDRAARRGMINLETASTRLRATNFRYPPALLEALLVEDRQRHGET